MKSLRLLILFLCGYLLAFGLGYLWEVKNDLVDNFGNFNSSSFVFVWPQSSGEYSRLVSRTKTPYTPPRWIRERAAWDAAHPRIRRIENGRVYTVGWKQTGVVYKGEVFDLEGRRTGWIGSN